MALNVAVSLQFDGQTTRRHIPDNTILSYRYMSCAAMPLFQLCAAQHDSDTQCDGHITRRHIPEDSRLNPLKSSGYFCPTSFNNQKFYFLSSDCIRCFVWILEQ